MPGSTSRTVLGAAAILGLLLTVAGCGEAPARGAMTNPQLVLAQLGQTEAVEPAAEGADMAHPFAQRIKAPSLEGEDWLNTSGPLELRDLRGKFVILDFWTYCCINCIHILPELKKLEHAYPNELVVIGVHSAKFDTEKDLDNIREAVMRYEIEHPVVNDPEHEIWNRFQVSSWPSLRVIDPEGNLIAGHGGEIDFESLDAFMKQAIPYYEATGKLDRTPVHFTQESSKSARTPLRYPGKVLADEAGDRLFISDSNHNRIVVAKLDGTLVQTIGAGTIGTKDGSFETAEFNKPQGMALLGDVLYVADTENHMLRKVDLKGGQVTTIAGLGTQARNAWPGSELGVLPPGARFVGVPRETALNSPWALWIHGDEMFIAMAGPHQIWKMPLDESEIGPYAGNGREDIVDGPLLPRRPYETGFSSFAQPSGLTSDGKWLYVADSEGSSVRAVPLNGKGKVQTVVGTSGLPGARLFTFGDVDGAKKQARLQHVLGVTYHDKKLYIADTYNQKIKTIELPAGKVTTLAGTGESGSSDEPATFHEPAGLVYAAGKLYVADTNNHLIRTVDPSTGATMTLEIKGLEPPTPPKKKPSKGFPGQVDVVVEPVTVQPVDGKVVVQVELQLPLGYKINTLAPAKYVVDAPQESGPIDRSAVGEAVDVKNPKTELTIEVPVTAAKGKDELRVSMPIYYCQEGAEGLCKMAAVAWTVPITLDPKADAKAVTLTHEVK